MGTAQKLTRRLVDLFRWKRKKNRIVYWKCRCFTYFECQYKLHRNLKPCTSFELYIRTLINFPKSQQNKIINGTHEPRGLIIKQRRSCVHWYTMEIRSAFVLRHRESFDLIWHWWDYVYRWVSFFSFFTLCKKRDLEEWIPWHRFQTDLKYPIKFQIVARCMGMPFF